MKKRNILISIILIFYGVFTGCGQNDSPLYPIPTLQVEEGLEKGFDLSVYKLSPQSELRIENHPRIVHRFFPNSDSLFLKVSSESPGRMVLKGWIDGQPFHLLVRVKPMVKHRFEYGPKPGEESVIVMGGFNDWSRTELNMDRVGDRFVKEVVLKPQRHEYKFVVDGEELIDPGNPVFVSNNIGGWNSILDLSDHQEKPAGRLIKVTQNSRELVFDYLSPGDGSLPAVYQVFMNNTPIHDDVLDFFP